MKTTAYEGLERVREGFRALCSRLEEGAEYLPGLQERLRLEKGYGDYSVETSVVYNEALDDIDARGRIDFIIVADNPGKKEQLAANRRYLVGQSGKLAEGYFRERLGVDFRSNVAILNKTPIHTPKTAELKRLLSLAEEEGPGTGADLCRRFEESQVAMAGLARELHGALGSVLWLSGLGELGPKGLFGVYAGALERAYRGAPRRLRERVWLFRHFSMNQFAIEVKAKAEPGKALIEELERIGTENRRRVLGW